MYDLVIRNGTVVDGTSAPARKGDVCIRNGRIAEIVSHYEGKAVRIIDAEEKIVAPGFIDIHSHSDGCPLVDYLPESKVYQGVTSELCGNCGISVLPSTPENRKQIDQYIFSELELPMEGAEIQVHTVSDYENYIKNNPIATNYGLLIGHGTLRGCVMGFENRDPNEQELQRLKERLAQEMEQGAFGLSLGLIYAPSAFCKTWELDALAEVVKKYDGILAVHMRSEGARVMEAVEEMLGVAARTGVHLQISHLKVATPAAWGKSAELLERIDTARAQGIHVTCDQYPYDASANSLTSLLPHWAHDGGVEAMMERVKNPTQELRAEIAANINRRGATRLLIASTRGVHPDWEGKTVAQIAQALETDAVEAVLEILRQCGTEVFCTVFSMQKDDVKRIFSRKDIAVGSDAFNLSYDPNITRDVLHPRNFATFPRAIQLAREEALLSLEEVVYKMTGLPASMIGMEERGVLKEGKIADVTIFDYQQVKDNSTYTKPVQKPSGIEYVITAGQVVLQHGIFTGLKPGTALLRGKC